MICDQKLTSITISTSPIQLKTKPISQALSLFIIHLSLFYHFLLSFYPYIQYHLLPLFIILPSLYSRSQFQNPRDYWIIMLTVLEILGDCFGFNLNEKIEIKVQENSLHGWQFNLLPSYGIEWHACMHVNIGWQFNTWIVVKCNNVLTCARVY